MKATRHLLEAFGTWDKGRPKMVDAWRDNIQIDVVKFVECNCVHGRSRSFHRNVLGLLALTTEACITAAHLPTQPFSWHSVTAKEHVGISHSTGRLVAYIWNVDPRPTRRRASRPCFSFIFRSLIVLRPSQAGCRETHPGDLACGFLTVLDRHSGRQAS